jgi:hypothetical protein
VACVDTPGIATGVAIGRGEGSAHAYVADGTPGLIVVDVTDPRAPRVIGGVDTPGVAVAVALNWAFAFVADGAGGLRLVSRQCEIGLGIGPPGPPPPPDGTAMPLPARARLAAPYPNPFNPRVTVPFTLARAAAVHLAVFDAAGRLVAPLLDGERPAGAGRVVWDGCDVAGRPVASGPYFVRLLTEGTVESRSLLLAR